jgi:hypothetical protein
MMCCISSLGQDRPTPKTKNEANTTTTAVDLGRVSLHLLLTEWIEHPQSLLISSSRSESSRYENPRSIDSS